jgi:hypothetical protein
VFPSNAAAVVRTDQPRGEMAAPAAASKCAPPREDDGRLNDRTRTYLSLTTTTMR